MKSQPPQPQPEVLELAASNIANNPAFAHAGKRIEAAYKKEAKAIGTKWPKSKLFVNSLEEKLKSVNIIMDSGAFQTFRAGAPIPNALPFQKRVVEESFSSAASPSKVPRAEIVISDDSDSD